MSSSPSMPTPGRSSTRPAAKRRSEYSTMEEQAARKHNTPTPYFRLQDSLCKAFLQRAANQWEFDGLKHLFPFVREMSLLGFGREHRKLSVWVRSAFMAGHDLGRAHPGYLEEVLPGPALNLATHRVGVLKQCSGEECLTHVGLAHACDVVVNANWAEVPPDQQEAVLLDATLKTLRTGFAAATASRVDPAQTDWLGDIPERIGGRISDIASRLVVDAPRNAVGKPVLDLLEHPLLRLARELYPDQPIQRQTMLGFLRGQLRALGVRSENDCPASELDLLDWIAAGIQYGTWLKEERAGLVQQIFDECGPKKLEDARSVVQQVVAEAGSIDATRLLPRLKPWQKSVYDWEEPGYYGEALARVAYFSDFAVWIPWIIPAEKEL